MTKSGDNTFIVDQKFTIQDISSFGLDSPEEFIGLKCHEQIFASNLPCKNCPVPRALKAGMSVESRVHQFFLKNSQKPRHIKAIPLSCNNSSTHLCIVNCYQNDDSTVFDRISSIRRIKKEDSPTGRKLKLLKDLPMLAVLLDSDMNVLDYNKNAEQSTNIIGNPSPLTATIFPHLSGIEFETKFKSFWKSSRQEESFTIEGQEHIFRHTIKTVLIDDITTAFLVLSDDLHDMFKTDIVPEKSLYNPMEILRKVEHDIKNPLNIILAEMQELQRISKSQQEELSAQSVINQLEIINEYFDRIRLLQPFSKENMGSVDFETLVKNAISSVKIQIPCSKVDFQTHFQENIPPIFCYEYNLQQAIQQVLINAVEAGEGNGIIKVTLKYENDWFTCTIVDSGNGIPKKFEDKVFDIFFTTKKERKADGVGLSIAHNIVYNHDGTIRMTSEENVGTTVSLNLPRTNSGKKN